MSAAGQRRQLHLPQHAGQPHGRGQADLQVEVGALVLHHHPEELVRFGLVGHRLDGCFDRRSPWACTPAGCEDWKLTCHDWVHREVVNPQATWIDCIGRRRSASGAVAGSLGEPDRHAAPRQVVLGLAIEYCR